MMQNYRKKLTLELAVVLTAFGICLTPTQSAIAQISDLETEALNILNMVTGKSSPPLDRSSVETMPDFSTLNSKFKIGIDNLNGNSINLCISGCFLPGDSELQPQDPQFSPTHLPIHFERL